MEKRMSHLKFRLMVHVGMPIRNVFLSPETMLSEVDIPPGARILDFGCGPGTFTRLLAQKTGPTGKVYALDNHPLAINMVEKQAREKKLSHIHTILSDCATSLPDSSLDLVVFFDVFHLLGNQEAVLVEIQRVLKPDGILSFSDHHMKEADIVHRLTEHGLFTLIQKGKITFAFHKIP